MMHGGAYNLLRIKRGNNILQRTFCKRVFRRTEVATDKQNRELQKLIQWVNCCGKIGQLSSRYYRNSFPDFAIRVVGPP